jgi:hypothetical protein
MFFPSGTRAPRITIDNYYKYKNPGAREWSTLNQVDKDAFLA